MIYLILYRATDERERDDLDASLAEPPPAIAEAQALAAGGRRPKGWGSGDDDAIEADAGLSALAALRTATRRR